MSDTRTLQTGRYAIDHIRKPVTVYFHDDIIASTDHALLVREEGAEPIYYIPRDRVHTAFFVDSRCDGVAYMYGPAAHNSGMHVDMRVRVLRVLDLHLHAARRQVPGVANLATTLGVKRRLVEDQLYLIALTGLGGRLTVLDDADDLCVDHQRLVATERRLVYPKRLVDTA